MKYVILFFILMVELILSGTVFQVITVFGSTPEILLITIMLYSMIFKREEAIILALVIGILADVLYGPYLGINTIAFGLIALIVSWLSANFSRQSIFTSILCLIVTLIGYYVMAYFLTLLFQGAMPLMIYLRRFNLKYLIINITVMLIIRYFMVKLTEYQAFSSDRLV